MPQVTLEFLNDVVTLAEKASQLEKKAEQAKTAAASTVDQLISAGLVNPSKRADFIKKMAADPTCVYATLKQVSRLVPARSMGQAEEKAADSSGPKKKESDILFERAFSPRGR